MQNIEDIIKKEAKKHLNKDGELDWDRFERDISPFLNKNMKLFVHIENYELKQFGLDHKDEECENCGSKKMSPVYRKKNSGIKYPVMKCNVCGSCNYNPEDELNG